MRDESREERQRRRWIEIKNKGRKRFILIYGILGFGLTTAVLSEVFHILFFHYAFEIPDFIIKLLLWPIIGWIWGSLMWRWSMKQWEHHDTTGAGGR